ncbi:hypothetical protein K435DRAFT_47991 [Dendrothele bispora CBS 962.96]|uniref:Uncharacterized protein n=1 Tax=Dendrothele bispora (strain CBS 962.96) TaxID=1314807 RepID=A0A4S8KSN9_DENBC|nr:hypothetical protein K435DRAFT_47991 [Dendrothele bispora CBS 962.96]
MSRESLTSLSLTASFAITSDTSISIHSEKLFVSPTTNPAYGEDEGDGDSSGGGIGGLPGGPSPVRPDATGIYTIPIIFFLFLMYTIVRFCTPH